jgi:D-proline reductase (dithiol) PrdB
VGHIARLLEESGIATVVIGSSIFRGRLEAMRLPRTLLTHHPMGRPLGAPGDRATQRNVLLAALELLNTATEGGRIADFATQYLPGRNDSFG